MLRAFGKLKREASGLTHIPVILLGFAWSYFGWPTYTRALGIHLADPEVGIMTKVYQMVSVKCQTLAEDMPRGGMICH